MGDLRAKIRRFVDSYVESNPERDGTPFTRSGIYSAYMRADAALHGKPIGLNPKALRPYAATAAKLQGFSSEDIQTGLAHVSIRTTEGYTSVPT